MSLSAAIIDALVASGATVEMLAAAVKADLAECEQRSVARRGKDAERQRKYRRSRRVTVTPRDSADAPPNEDISNPPVSSEPEGSSETLPPAPKKNGKDELRPEHVIEAWNLMADQSGVHKARMTEERLRKLRTLVRKRTVDDITEAIWAVPRSPFLCGENDRGWKAGLDFLLQPSSFTKMIEGTYDRQTD